MEINDIIICKEISPLQNNDVAPPLKLNGEYKIVNIYKCDCDQHHYDVGLESHYNYITCQKCRKELPNGDKIHWCHPNRFIKN